MIFNPLRVFVPAAIVTGSLGVLKMIYDLAALVIRYPEQGWRILLQPALSTSAILLMFVGFQLLMFGMVADGIIRRLALNKGLLLPSMGFKIVEEHLESRQNASMP